MNSIQNQNVKMLEEMLAGPNPGAVKKLWELCIIFKMAFPLFQIL